MKHPPTVFLSKSSPSVIEIWTADDQRATSIARLTNTGTQYFLALVYILHDPYSSSARWKSGDILIAGWELVGQSQEAKIWRYRRSPSRREPYRAEVLYKATGAFNFAGLGMDPFGRLYYSVAGASRKVYLLATGAEGSWAPIAFATIPERIPWDGTFAFDPDGSLYISTGKASTTGRIYKTAVRAEAPEIGANVMVQPIGGAGEGEIVQPAPGTIPGLWVMTAYSAATGEIHGFSFYDCDQIVYTNGSGSLYRAQIDPTLEVKEPVLTPSSPIWPQPPGIPAEKYSFPELNRRIEIIDVSVRSSRLGDYLQEHPEVGEALLWRTPANLDVPYGEWDSHVETQGFRRLLRRMYALCACNRSVEYSFQKEIHPQTGLPRIGPQLYDISAHRMSMRDAKEIYLAQVAHHLWMEVSRVLPWRIYAYTEEQRISLLSGAAMFFPASGQGSRYELNIDAIGSTIPTDPVRALRFLRGTDATIRLGESLIAATQSECLYALSHWVLNHLRHGPGGGLGLHALENYAYEGSPPLETMYERTVNPTDMDRDEQGNPIPRNWAWHGCHSAAALMVNLLRVLNIPAQVLKAYQWPFGVAETGFHHGVVVPSERLAFWHIDDLYANIDLKDPGLDMATVYNLGLDYDTYMAYFAVPPISPAESDSQWYNYAKWIGKVAVRNAVHEVLQVFWKFTIQIPAEDLPDVDCYNENKLKRIKFAIMDRWHLSLEEATEVLCENEQKFRQRISQFQAQFSTEIAALAANENTSMAWASLFLYQRKYNEWLASR